MCYCIHDTNGLCELSGFNTGKTSTGECSYTYSEPEDIKCDKIEEGWHEDKCEVGGEDFDLEVDDDDGEYIDYLENDDLNFNYTNKKVPYSLPEEKYKWSPSTWKNGKTRQ